MKNNSRNKVRNPRRNSFPPITDQGDNTDVEAPAVARRSALPFSAEADFRADGSDCFLFIVENLSGKVVIVPQAKKYTSPAFGMGGTVIHSHLFGK